MLLFENFTYNKRWASQFYEDFYNSSEYFKQYLNDGLNTIRYIYSVHRLYDKNHDNTHYEVFCHNKSDLFSNDFSFKHYAYAYNKLKEYGTCIQIDQESQKYFEEDGCSSQFVKLKFTYLIEKDEKRWNLEQQKYDAAFKTDEILNCNPTLEQWLYMIQAKYDRKNPSLLFRKENNVENISAKYIIAVKLNWDDAADAAFEKLSIILALPANIDKYSYQFKKFIKAYAEQYEMNSDIEELISDFKQSDKNNGDSIPTKYTEFAKKLDMNPLVQKYQYHYEQFDIQTTNENVGRLNICKDNKLGLDFYYGSLRLKSTRWNEAKKSHSYRFKALPIIIDSAVNAIYKNDVDELQKISVKL